MIFSSTLFTFGFLPLTLLFYYIAKERYRNYILLAASILFYAYGQPGFVFVMLASILINYLLALGIEKAGHERTEQTTDGTTVHPRPGRLYLVLAVLLNLGILFVFKYLDFSIRIIDSLFGDLLSPLGIALPIGISFFTFQALSYVIDVYWGTVHAQRNPFKVALYISFFPQLIAGPIVRYNTIADQIDHRQESFDKFGEGAGRFMLGFMKKVILANNLSLAAEKAFLQTDFASGSLLYSWIGALCFTLQIYYDFSGYSDMAVGLGKMFGFEFDENFNYPYFASSVTDFWRRWHISLSRWFRDYVYIPLGGSRVSVGRCILNLFCVWLLTGIWHGANYTFICWGLGYFALLVLEKYLIHPEKRGKVFRLVYRIFTLLCVNFLWVLFNSPSLNYAMNYLLSMTPWFRTPIGISDPQVLRVLREYGIFLLAGCLFSFPIMPALEKHLEKHTAGKRMLDYGQPVLYVLGFLWAVSYLILGAHNPFIYFNF